MFSGCWSGQDRQTCGFPIDRLAPHRSKAQSQSSDCRPGDFCTSILLNNCSSGSSGYLSPPWRLVTRRAWNLHVANFACGCEDRISTELKIHSFFDKLAESWAGTFPTPHFVNERGMAGLFRAVENSTVARLAQRGERQRVDFCIQTTASNRWRQAHNLSIGSKSKPKLSCPPSSLTSHRYIPLHIACISSVLPYQSNEQTPNNQLPTLAQPSK